VRAQEVQVKRVVRHLARAGHGLAVSEYLAVPSGGTGSGGVKELTPGHGDQPALGVSRRALRPPAHGFDHGVLHGVLGRLEVGSAADEDPDHDGGEGPQQGLIHRASLRDGRGCGQERPHLEPLVDRLPARPRSR
jgi:hypothetical protein